MITIQPIVTLLNWTDIPERDPSFIDFVVDFDRELYECEPWSGVDDFAAVVVKPCVFTAGLDTDFISS